MVKLVKSGFRKDKAILSVFLLIIVISVFILHSGIFASMYSRLYDEYAHDQELADGFAYTDADHEFVESVLAGNKDIVSYAVQDMLEIKSIKYTTSRNSSPEAGRTGSIPIPHMPSNTMWRCRYPNGMIRRSGSILKRRFFSAKAVR